MYSKNEITSGQRLVMDYLINSIIRIEYSIISNWTMQKQKGHFRACWLYW